jgi:hypothetical protein
LVSCPECDIGLPDETRRCPECGRRLRFPVWVMATLEVTLLAALAVGLYGSGAIKNRLVLDRVTPTDAYGAVREYLREQLRLRRAIDFSRFHQSVVERWDARRWQVSGYVDTQEESGARIRTHYLCVVRYDGQDHWALEDVHLATGE